MRTATQGVLLVTGIITIGLAFGCFSKENERKENSMHDSLLPTWELNQQWKIKMNIPTNVEFTSTSLQPFLETIVLEYKVEAVPDGEGNQILIFVCEEGAPPDYGYKVYLRTDPVSLEKVVRVSAGVEELQIENGVQVCYRPLMDISDYIWDFPVFPISKRDKRKTGLIYHNTEVIETVIPEGNVWVVTWEIPTEIVSFQAIQQWQHGKPWFVKAERYWINHETNEKILYSFGKLIE